MAYTVRMTSGDLQTPGDENIVNTWKGSIPKGKKWQRSEDLDDVFEESEK